jgi:cell shape-determining protein MreC
MKKSKPTRREINDVIKSFNNIFYALEQRIRGLEFVLSEYFKYRKTEKKFEKYLKRKDDEKKADVKKSDAGANGTHIQGGATNS